MKESIQPSYGAKLDLVSVEQDSKFNCSDEIRSLENVVVLQDIDWVEDISNSQC